MVSILDRGCRGQGGGGALAGEPPPPAFGSGHRWSPPSVMARSCPVIAPFPPGVVCVRPHTHTHTPPLRGCVLDTRTPLISLTFFVSGRGRTRSDTGHVISFDFKGLRRVRPNRVRPDTRTPDTETPCPAPSRTRPDMAGHGFICSSLVRHRECRVRPQAGHGRTWPDMAGNGFICCPFHRRPRRTRRRPWRRVRRARPATSVPASGRPHP